MYICKNCGDTFSTPDYIKQYHPYGNSSAAENIAVCPSCSDNNIAEAIECEECGEWCERTFTRLCDDCNEVIYGKN